MPKLSILPIPLTVVRGALARRSRRLSALSVPPAARALAAAEDPVVSCGGGGIFFFWQLGAARALLEHRALVATNAPPSAPTPELRWAGSSAGALASALSVCGIDPEAAVRKAHQIAVESGVYERKSGLVGVWGDLICQWLEALLPEDAHERCNGRLTVLLSVFGGWRKGLRVERVDTFPTRSCLVECLLGSAHLPWFLNGQPFRRIVVKGRTLQVCDGSAAGYLKMWREAGVKDEDCCVRSAHAPHRKPDFWISHLDDMEYVENAPKFTDLVGVETAFKMVDRGHSFMKESLESGITESLAYTLAKEEQDRWAWFVEAGFGGKETAGEMRPRHSVGGECRRPHSSETECGRRFSFF